MKRNTGKRSLSSLLLATTAVISSYNANCIPINTPPQIVQQDGPQDTINGIVGQQYTRTFATYDNEGNFSGYMIDIRTPNYATTRWIIVDHTTDDIHYDGRIIDLQNGDKTDITFSNSDTLNWKDGSIRINANSTPVAYGISNLGTLQDGILTITATNNYIGTSQLFLTAIDTHGDNSTWSGSDYVTQLAPQQPPIQPPSDSNLPDNLESLLERAHLEVTDLEGNFIDVITQQEFGLRFFLPRQLEAFFIPRLSIQDRNNPCISSSATSLTKTTTTDNLVIYSANGSIIREQGCVGQEVVEPSVEITVGGITRSYKDPVFANP